ncbi:MAG TPA: peroxiredoxin [Pyrinomonadaceae bacterium]|nr:peroxiredoxin [Pyrinomonadaceae bacterium]
MTKEAAVAASGVEAPDFTLKDSHGRDWRLSGKRGRVVVLLFYPRDETPVCTRQMCSVRDHWSEYAATGAEVVGVSTDSPESHRKFAEHHKLPFTLLSDPGGRVARQYGAASWLPGRAARAVVIIGADGRVRHLKVQPVSLFRPKDEEVLAAIRAASV